MKLVTAKTFDNAIDAHLLKTKLESEDIKAYLFDEHKVSLNQNFSQTLGGIKLKIHDFDVEKARTILNKIDANKYTNDNGVVISCSKCQSTAICTNFKSIKNFRGILAIFISFFSLTVPFLFKSVIKCKSCNFEFND